MMKACFVLLALSILMLVGCSKETPPLSVELGQSKDEVRRSLGDPHSVHMSIKKNEAIWGPEEEFWHRIPEGSAIETWNYQLEDGQLNLYFVDGSATLDYKAFAPEGVVYESLPERP